MGIPRNLVTLRKAADSGETDLGDWDWGEIQEATPTQPAATDMRRRKDKKRKGPQVGSTAEPDFNRVPLPGQQVFADMPAFTVVPSRKDTDMHPCSDCHEWAESDLTPRPLQDPHDNFTLDHGLHGKGEFWCFTCHDLERGGACEPWKAYRWVSTTRTWSAPSAIPRRPATGRSVLTASAWRTGQANAPS
ncbi:MAG: hypothetical protein U9R74_10525 [Pseudomonadota bacterium]|nr:hypothetical protein [Pseudomonadota bacterium]